MKRLFALAAVALALPAAAQTPVNPNATPEAKGLLKMIYELSAQNKILAGQHSYPLFGDVYFERAAHQNSANQHPVVCGQDFGYSAPGTLDGIDFRQRSIENAIKWWNKGAIVTFMWHAVPPIYDQNYTIWRGENGIQSQLTEQQWNDIFTPGTAINERWKAQVDVIAFFLRELQDAGIPVIWRPYHEMNGDWFWWCAKPGDNGYKRLYRQLYDRFTNFHHLNNLIWVFNANEISGPNVGEYKDFFPGADVVDILATDVYYEKYFQKDYDDLVTLANGKPIAIGECGKFPTPDILKKQPKWAWFMCWGEWLETANKQADRDDLYGYQQTITLEKFNQEGLRKKFVGK